MEKFRKAYQFVNILSLDVAIGAVSSALFFAKIFGVAILPQGLISLGLTVWIIYTADHLLDAKKVQQSAATARHRFHQQHFKVLLMVMIVALLVDATQVILIRKSVFIEGLLLALIVAIYFLLQQRLKFLKEFVGALLYTYGVLLIPLSVRIEVLTPAQMVLMIQFGLTALINLMLFSWFDFQHDARDEQQSFTTTFGERTTKKFIMVLFLIMVLLSALQFMVSYNSSASTILILMNAMLLFIFLNKEYFKVNDRYRLLGDSIFIFPLALLV